MIEFLIGLVVGIAIFFVGAITGMLGERRRLENQSKYWSNADITPFLESVDDSKPSVETRLIQVIQEVDEPMTYLKLSSQMPAIDEKEVKRTVGKLVAEGKVVKKSAGHKGMYLKLNSFGKE